MLSFQLRKLTISCRFWSLDAIRSFSFILTYKGLKDVIFFLLYYYYLLCKLLILTVLTTHILLQCCTHRYKTFMTCSALNVRWKWHQVINYAREWGVMFYSYIRSDARSLLKLNNVPRISALNIVFKWYRVSSENFKYYCFKAISVIRASKFLYYGELLIHQECNNESLIVKKKRENGYGTEKQNNRTIKNLK